MDALRVIELGGVQIALVVDEEKRLLGTLTDGDIRRALLHGETLESQVQKFMSSNFRFIRFGDDQSNALQMMRRESLRQIPVIDTEGRVVQLLLLEQCKVNSFVNPVVIMAGGKGTRLRPHTEHCPKPMLLVDGKPILEILLRQCIACGFRNFYFSVNYLKEQIIDYFGDGRDWV